MTPSGIGNIGLRDTPKLELVGAGNFRDLSALCAANGRRLKAHALMRSDQLCGLTDADWRLLAAVPLATICDLRTVSERRRHPNRMPATIATRLMEFDVRNDVEANHALASMLARTPTRQGAEDVMVTIYRRFPRYFGPVLRRIVARLLVAGAPMLIHCAAGKDRTGFVVAILLRALGFTEETVEADYLSSRGRRDVDSGRLAIAAKLSSLPVAVIDEVLDPVLDVRVEYLAAAFAAITEEFGSFDDYLRQEIGIAGRDRERLCGALFS